MVTRDGARGRRRELLRPHVQALAARKELAWTSVNCEVSGTVDRCERHVQFTAFTIRARVMLLPGASADVTKSVLEKSKDGCLISNSLPEGAHRDVCRPNRWTESQASSAAPSPSIKRQVPP